LNANLYKTIENNQSIVTPKEDNKRTFAQTKNLTEASDVCMVSPTAQWWLDFCAGS
jgi:hypothetical protein